MMISHLLETQYEQNCSSVTSHMWNPQGNRCMCLNFVYVCKSLSTSINNVCLFHPTKQTIKLLAVYQSENFNQLKISSQFLLVYLNYSYIDGTVLVLFFSGTCLELFINFKKKDIGFFLYGFLISRNIVILRLIFVQALYLYKIFLCFYTMQRFLFCNFKIKNQFTQVFF